MKQRFLFFLLTGLLVVSQVAYYGCGSSTYDNKDVEEGYQLAKVHCAGCHSFPEPSLLNKVTWSKFVLPKMAPHLGFTSYLDGYMIMDNHPRVMTIDQWYNLVSYYTTVAPDSPLKREHTIGPIQKQTAQFTAIGLYAGFATPVTTLVSIDASRKRILFGDGSKEMLYTVSADRKVIDSVKTGAGPCNIRLTGSSWYILTMGVIRPSDARAGQLLTTDTSFHKTGILLDSLQRPVHVAYSQLTNDSLEDIIVCEFGNQSGYLGWFENKGNGNYTKHVLRPLPGATKTVVQDMDGDGRKDIIALMAQGDEGFFIYYNQGNGTFREERVLQFPPSYGFNYFELHDFNNDGFADIITTNGDNGDYSPILKAYHGIRLFLNDGKNKFTEKLFLPVNGAGKVIANDFDADGDLDLASIAYFPDFRNMPEEAFIYWENKGDLQFEPSSVAQVTDGRWLTMDAGDIDGDGDTDLVLGNTDFRLGDIPEELQKKWDASSPSLLILKNNLR